MYVPTTTVFPLMATAWPRLSPCVPLDAVSLAACDQSPPELRNTYAAPWSLLEPMLAPDAPATTVLPAMATEQPKVSYAAPSDAENLAACVHPLPEFTKTYAAPCSGLEPIIAYSDPTTIVVPLMATDEPNPSWACPSDAVIS